MDFYWGAVIVIFHGDQSQSAKSKNGRQKKKNLIIYGMEEVETILVEKSWKHKSVF